jgi:2-dehydro-3-deoxyphosphogluconate aldolase/(4S)-4-hydroxy-2-oxoglutarate aldolase
VERAEVRGLITDTGVIPAIRVSTPEDAWFAAEAVASGGIPIVEITMTVPGAVEVIAHLKRHAPGLVVGAGTVWDNTTAQRCLDAGADFLTSTGLDVPLVEFANKRNVVIIPGAMTPTEVMVAWKGNVDFVKIFPVAELGGPVYIRALKAPFPQIPLIASGGVNELNLADYFEAGATAVGIGGHLVPKKAIELKQARRIRELASRCKNIVVEARRAAAASG